MSPPSSSPDGERRIPVSVAVHSGHGRRILVQGDTVKVNLGSHGLLSSNYECLTYKEAWALGLALIRAGDIASGLPIERCEPMRDGSTN